MRPPSTAVRGSADGRAAMTIPPARSQRSFARRGCMAAPSSTSTR
ncbi:hypothetical protein AZ78_2628 [Lysobacter capsici AZ78]|uniref:Uncharacterized protein n=1 Tax=Lysobacter capsici AZ78 TaxID=1444315 RepID=A0A120AGT2_9GAMM|nr:hypothetical protein AZ78_2628 [Lysobacter capsici AZ78]